MRTLKNIKKIKKQEDVKKEEEIKYLKKEFKDNDPVWQKLPTVIKETEDEFDFQIKGLEIKLRNGLKVLTPFFEFEKSEEYLKWNEKEILKKINTFKKNKTATLERLKEQQKRLGKRRAEIKQRLKVLGEKEIQHTKDGTKSTYIG